MLILIIALGGFSLEQTQSLAALSKPELMHPLTEVQFCFLGCCAAVQYLLDMRNDENISDQGQKYFCEKNLRIGIAISSAEVTLTLWLLSQ